MSFLALFKIRVSIAWHLSSIPIIKRENERERERDIKEEVNPKVGLEYTAGLSDLDLNLLA